MNYNIVGMPFPVVICDVAAGESLFCQKGAMAWMSGNMRMRTRATQGGLGGMFSRAMTGESVFQNEYIAENGAGAIAFRADTPGEILAMPIAPGRTILAQKGAYLASEPGVNIEIGFQKSLGAGIAGGEGFVLQRFTGTGIVFLGIDGTTVDYTLQAGEVMVMDTGTFAACEETVRVDVEIVQAASSTGIMQSIGNIAFGGEGLFNTRAVGPGKIWMQTMPIRKA